MSIKRPLARYIGISFRSYTSRLGRFYLLDLLVSSDAAKAWKAEGRQHWAVVVTCTETGASTHPVMKRCVTGPNVDTTKIQNWVYEMSVTKVERQIYIPLSNIIILWLPTGFFYGEFKMLHHTYDVHVNHEIIVFHNRSVLKVTNILPLLLFYHYSTLLKTCPKSESKFIS